jgi:hypothetical protein
LASLLFLRPACGRLAGWGAGHGTCSGSGQTVVPVNAEDRAGRHRCGTACTPRPSNTTAMAAAARAPSSPAPWSGSPSTGCPAGTVYRRTCGCGGQDHPATPRSRPALAGLHPLLRHRTHLPIRPPDFELDPVSTGRSAGRPQGGNRPWRLRFWRGRLPASGCCCGVDAPPAVDAVTAGGDEPVLTKPESGQLAGDGAAVDARVQLGPLNDPGRGRVRNVVWG